MTQFFQLTLYLYLLATVVYVVHFLSQKKQVRTIARGILLAGGILHTAYFVVRYLAAGYTPLTSMHEAVSFFAWSMTWAFLSFWWRYRVKNFGVFVAPLISLLMLIAAFVSRDSALAPRPKKQLASCACQYRHHGQRLSCPGFLRRDYVPPAGTGDQKEKIRNIL